MSKSNAISLITVFFSAGVLGASAFFVSSFWVYIFLAFTILGIILSFYLEKKFLRNIFLLFSILALGILRFNASTLNNQYEQYFNTKQSLEGYVVSDISPRENNQILTFLPNGFNQQIRINTTLTQKFFYGDKIVVEGKISEAENFSDFDYVGYLERHNVYAVMSYPKVLILKSHQLSYLKEALLKIKYAVVDKINNQLLEPQSSLLLGILIGGQNSLPKQVKENFNYTGTSHIIAVSGFNITIIAVALSYLAYLIGRRFSFYLSVVVILSFVIITGASASVIRAAIMGLLFLFATQFGRQYKVSGALFFAALVMLIINPKILLWDIGFQLSFLATLGIVYFLPVFEQLTQNIPKLFGIKITLLTTLSATLTTLPIILFNFGTLSFSALIVNLLILPIVPAVMLFGFLSLLPFFGTGFAFIVNWFLLYILKVTEFFANIPYSYIIIKISLNIFLVVSLGIFALYFALKFGLAKQWFKRKKNLFSENKRNLIN